MFYFDTSALAKLVVAEAETPALRDWIAVERRDAVACDLVRTELMRAVRRIAPDRSLMARQVLEAVSLIRVTPRIFDAAGRLEPADLRSLDSIHLAAALDLGDDMEAMVTYDVRFAAAAEANGLPVLAPS